MNLLELVNVKDILENEMAMALIFATLMSWVIYSALPLVKSMIVSIRNGIVKLTTGSFILKQNESQFFSVFESWMQHQTPIFNKGVEIANIWNSIVPVPACGNFLLKPKGMPFIYVNKNEETYGGTKRIVYTLTFIAFTRKASVTVIEGIKAASSQKESKIYKADGTYFDSLNFDAEFYLSQYVTDDCQSIIDDINTWNNNKEHYYKRALKYRRGYVLHGRPGTGKSTIIGIISATLRMPIYYIEAGDLYKLPTLASRIPAGSIIVIEDIDFANLAKRELPKHKDMNTPPDDDTSDSGGSGESLVSNPNNNQEDEFFTMLEQMGSAGMATILNTLDGLLSATGSIIIATTNNIEKLDSALLRPGRIDKIIEIDNLTTKDTVNIVCRYFEVDVAKDIEDLHRHVESQLDRNIVFAEVIEACVSSTDIDTAFTSLYRDSK